MLVCATATAAAQTGPPDAEVAAERARAAFDEIVAELDLDANQEEQVRAILAENAADREALMQQAREIRAAGGSRRSKLGQMQDLRGDMQALAEETRAELAEVLDDEQLAEFDAIADERRAELRERIRNRRPR